VDEDIGPIILGNKPIPLLIVKPFYSASCHVNIPPT
jgi:hypothetical protein